MYQSFRAYYSDVVVSWSARAVPAAEFNDKRYIAFINHVYVHIYNTGLRAAFQSHVFTALVVNVFLGLKIEPRENIEIQGQIKSYNLKAFPADK